MNANSPPASTAKIRWLYRATTVQLAGIAVLVGIVVWLLLAGTDLVATVYSVTVPMVTVDSIVALACGALVFKLLIAERSRTRQIVARLHMIAEINHHIRNALDRIELTAHVTRNQQLIADIDGGVKRIQWALQELLPESEESDELAD